jgi:S1-C subfamily serine protease
MSTVREDGAIVLLRGDASHRIALRPYPSTDMQIPSIDVVMDEYHGEFADAWLGVDLLQMTNGLGDCFGTHLGALVTSVGSDLLGETAGVKAGDVLLRVNGRIAPDIAAIDALIGQHSTDLRLSVIRDRREIPLRAVTPLIGPGKRSEGSHRVIEPLGLHVHDAEAGAAVAEASAEGLAAKAGLHPDDVITTFDGEAVKGAEHLTRLVYEAPPGRSVLLTLQRGRESSRLVLPAQSPDSADSRAFGELDATVAEVHGRRVVSVVGPATGAASAGLQRDDVIVGIGDESAKSLPHLTRLLYETSPLLPLTATVIRNDQRLSIHMEPTPSKPFAEFREHRTVEDLEFLDASPLGGELAELTDQLADYFGVAGGLLVTAMPPRTPGAAAGIKACDVITKVDSAIINGKRGFRSHLAWNSEDPADRPQITLVRQGRPLVVNQVLPLLPSTIIR